MSLFNFFKKKQKVDPVEEFYKSHLPKYDEKLLFFSLVKGKRLIHMFYGNTDKIQKNKRDRLQKDLEQAVHGGLFRITSGEESIAYTMQKKELVTICKELGVPVSGNKIDLVRRIKSIEENYFDKYDVKDWILIEPKGREIVRKYEESFKIQYDHMQQTIYNLLLNDKQKEALKLFEMYRNSYPFEKRDGFFIHYNEDEFRKLVLVIRSTNVFDKIGFPKIYANAFKTLMCVYFMFGDFDLKEKFEEAMEGSTDLIIRSPLIKNKDLPFVDLKDLVRGYSVKKFENKL